jgi:hypothetical protein
MLADIEDDDPDANVNAMTNNFPESYTAAYMGNNSRGSQRGRGRFRGFNNSRRVQNSGSQFCRLCHLSRQPRNITLVS